MTNNQLTHAQMYNLCDWVKTNAELLSDTTLVKAADYATDGLKFTVTVANVTNARDITGVPMGRAMTKSVNTDRVQIVAVALVKLFSELGQVPPTDLVRIAQRKGQTV
jgi:hypothetical protein